MVQFRYESCLSKKIALPSGTQSINASTYTGKATVTTPSFSDSGLFASTTYWYRVRAVNVNGESAYGNIASAKTLAPPPPPVARSSLTAKAISRSQITLSWLDNSTNEDGFKIEKRPSGTTSFVAIAAVAPNVKTFRSSGLLAGKTYYYRVTAYNQGGSFSYSKTASATTFK